MIVSRRFLTLFALFVLLFALALFSVAHATLDAALIGPDAPVLDQGKRLILVSEPTLVTEFMAANPDVMAVSYFDSGSRRTIGYVRALGGVGKTFYMEPGVPYELYLNVSAPVQLPA